MASWLQRIARIARHRLQAGSVRRAFPAQQLEQLEATVRQSEAHHSGQIRLCIEGGLPYSYLLRDAPARERAITLFGKLRTWDTEHNNGVLIYLLLADHAIEIVADRALARRVAASEWQAITQTLSTQCQAGHYVQGLEQALARVSDTLAEHFPADGAPPAQDNLPDRPALGGRFSQPL